MTYSTIATRVVSGFTFVCMFLVVGCQHNDTSGIQETSQVRQVKTAAELKSLMGKGDVVLVHALDAENYRNGHIPGAIHIDYQTMTADKLPAQKDVPLVFYCSGGACPVGAMAAQKAAGWGYTNVYEYAGGMNEWRSAGNSLAKGS